MVNAIYGIMDRHSEFDFKNSSIWTQNHMHQNRKFADIYVTDIAPGQRDITREPVEYL